MKFQLSTKERDQLERQRRLAHDGRIVRRSQALLWLDEGRSITEVAKLCGVSRQTVYNWINYFNSRGRSKEALADAPRSGRPPVLNGERQAKLEEIMAQGPQALGYCQTTWTVPLLLYHLKDHYQVEVSDSTLRRTLHKMRYCWKRPRYILARRDPKREVKKGRSAVKWIRLQKGQGPSLVMRPCSGSSPL